MTGLDGPRLRLAEDKRRFLITVLLYHFWQLLVEHPLEDVWVLGIWIAVNVPVDPDWPVLLSECLNHMVLCLEPPSDILNVRNGCTCCHYSHLPIRNHQTSHNGLECCSTILDIEHMDLVDEEEIQVNFCK